PTATFTGTVYMEMHSADATAAIATVTFTPCARTHWHTHEGGQVIKVTSGSGWICDLGGQARRISAGDVVWAPPGTTHWHGADQGSVMTHFVVGMGKTVWGGEVAEGEYNAREGGQV
ncbi:cupin domain-containing protein, partial [Aspergillus ellipticus CBS 707.79]